MSQKTSSKGPKDASKEVTKKSKSYKLPIFIGVLALSAVYVDWLAFFAWSLWSFQIMTWNWDACPANNHFITGLFKRIEQRDLDFSRVVEPTPLLSIPKEEYSYERLEQVSQGFTLPVVVRGLFKDIDAVKLWTPDFLADAMGDHEVNTIQNGSIARHHEMVCSPKFSDWAKQEPVNQVLREMKYPNCIKTVVYPPASRSKRVREQDMEKLFNSIVSRDIPLSRIGGGFATGLKNTALTQLFAGNGVEGLDVGSGWHCDICNNFVVQVAGYKEWTFIHPKYSKYLRPSMRPGKGAIAGSDSVNIIRETVPYLPKQQVVLEAGDFLYNPDWLWHQVYNPAGTGFTMGVVSRECHFARSMRENFIFTSLIMGQHLVLSLSDPEAFIRLKSGILGTSMMVNDTAKASV